MEQSNTNPQNQPNQPYSIKPLEAGGIKDPETNAIVRDFNNYLAMLNALQNQNQSNNQQL